MHTPSSPLARTPLHDWHAAHQAHFAESDGWHVAMRYAALEHELAAARQGPGMVDVSAFAKISLLGSGLPVWVSELVSGSPAARVRSVARLPGEDSVLACRLTEDHLLLLASTTTAALLTRRLESLPLTLSILQSDVTSAYAGFCLMGSPLEEILRRVTALDVASAALPVNACAETSVAGVPALLVRVPEFAFPSLRLYVAWDLGEDVWERLLDAGREWALTPLGLETFHHLRRTHPPENVL